MEDVTPSVDAVKVATAFSESIAPPLRPEEEDELARILDAFAADAIKRHDCICGGARLPNGEGVRLAIYCPVCDGE